MPVWLKEAMLKQQKQRRVCNNSSWDLESHSTGQQQLPWWKLWTATGIATQKAWHPSALKAFRQPALSFSHVPVGQPILRHAWKWLSRPSTACIMPGKILFRASQSFILTSRMHPSLADWTNAWLASRQSRLGTALPPELLLKITSSRLSGLANILLHKIAYLD